MLFLPLNIAILPNSLKRYVEFPYITSFNNISKDEIRYFQPHLDSNAKSIVLFIGGFCDTIHRAMFNYFKMALQVGFIINNNDMAKNDFASAYLGFRCYGFLRDFIPRILNDGYEIYIISHSWGAKNFLRFAFTDNLPTKMLITLDCVCHFSINNKPSNIEFWENIYIQKRILSNVSNIVSIIGGAKNDIAVADSNIEIGLPATHSSVGLMLSRSNAFRLKE